MDSDSHIERKPRKRVEVHSKTLPKPVVLVMRKLGGDLQRGRKLRKISVQNMAERLFVSRGTVSRMEKGEPNVAVSVYVTALWVLGLHEKLSTLADMTYDPLGRMITDEMLPKRIRMGSKRKTGDV